MRGVTHVICNGRKFARWARKRAKKTAEKSAAVAGGRAGHSPWLFWLPLMHLLVGQNAVCLDSPRLALPCLVVLFARTWQVPQLSTKDEAGCKGKSSKITHTQRLPKCLFTCVCQQRLCMCVCVCVRSAHLIQVQRNKQITSVLCKLLKLNKRATRQSAKVKATFGQGPNLCASVCISVCMCMSMSGLCCVI